MKVVVARLAAGLALLVIAAIVGDSIDKSLWLWWRRRARQRGGI